MLERVTVSHVVAGICWVSIAVLPYFWIAQGEFTKPMLAALAFWFIVGFVATANTMNLRRKK